MDNIDMKMKGIIKCTFTASCPAATVLHRKATDQVCSANDASSEAAWVKVAPIPRKGTAFQLHWHQDQRHGFTMSDWWHLHSD